MILHFDFALSPENEVLSNSNQNVPYLFTLSVAMSGESATIAILENHVNELWNNNYELFEINKNKTNRICLIGDVDKSNFCLFGSDPNGRVLCSIVGDYVGSEFHLLFKNPFFSIIDNNLYICTSKDKLEDYINQHKLVDLIKETPKVPLILKKEPELQPQPTANRITINRPTAMVEPENDSPSTTSLESEESLMPFEAVTSQGLTPPVEKVEKILKDVALPSIKKSIRSKKANNEKKEKIVDKKDKLKPEEKLKEKARSKGIKKEVTPPTPKFLFKDLKIVKPKK